VTAAAELMNLYWSAAGIFPGKGELSPFDFEDRVKSTAAAGFTGIGFWHADIEHCCLHRSLKEMKSILDDNGIRHIELEFLTDWFAAGARKAESDSRKRRLLDASTALGAKHIKIGDFYNSPCPMPRLVEAFAALCKEADEYGATIGFEFMRSATLGTLSESLAMVEAAGARNGGVIVDIAHVVDLGIPFEEISAIPARHLVCVELNDGTLPGKPGYEPWRRRFCGEGEFDIRGFIAAVNKTGYAGPWAVEIFSPDLADWSLDDLNRRAFETTIGYLD
jgi:sugar phosphate isomerase/epimerase